MAIGDSPPIYSIFYHIQSLRLKIIVQVPQEVRERFSNLVLSI